MSIIGKRLQHGSKRIENWELRIENWTAGIAVRMKLWGLLFWVLSSVFCVLCSEFCVLCSEFWVLSSVFCVLSSELVLGFWWVSSPLTIHHPPIKFGVLGSELVRGSNSSLITHYSLLITHLVSPIPSRIKLIIHYSPLTQYFLSCKLWAYENLLPVKLPTAHCWLLTADSHHNSLFF